MSDNSGPIPIYQPEPDAHGALERDHRDWTGAGHLPPDWIIALAGTDPDAPHGIDICGTWVTFTVAVTTDDPAVICTALRKLRRIVTGTPLPAPGIPTIDRRLPQQIGSARWLTPFGNVTVIRPERTRHRKPRRHRLAAFGAAPAALWAILHGKVHLAPLGAAAGIAAVAMVPALPSPGTPPPAPVPGHTREAFVPARTLPAAVTGTKPGTPRPPRRTRMSAPVQTSTTPADRSKGKVPPATLPTVTITLPVTGLPASTPSTPKASVPPSPKIVRRVIHRACVTVTLPLLGKKTTCRRS